MNSTTLKRETAGGQPAASTQNHNRASITENHYSTKLNLEYLLQKTDLVELVRQSGVDLHRSGKEFRGRCPIHHGDNATAFVLYEDENEIGRWHCHTKCQRGGDAIDFVQRTQGIDFLNAVRYLAKFSGLSMEHIGFTAEMAKERDKQRQLSALFDESARYYVDCLTKNTVAQDYLTGRGFTIETIQQAGWGYSDSSIGLSNHFQMLGVNLGIAQKLGLLRKDRRDFTANGDGSNASPDGYIVMPHRVGERIGYFSARAITPPDRMPNKKDKSRNLPGPRQAYWALVPDDPNVVIVEGVMDAESLRQLGISAMALCGLGSIPEGDLARTKNRRVISISLDNDRLVPGLSAKELHEIETAQEQTLRRLCGQLGPLAMVVSDLPDKDWNAALQADISSQHARNLLTQHSKPWIELRIQALQQAAPAEIPSLTNDIQGMIKELDAPVRQRYMNRTAKVLGIPVKQFSKLVDAMPDTTSDTTAEITNGKLHYMGQSLGNFWARISRELNIHDGVNPPRVEYEVAGGLATGETLPTLHIEAAQFANLGWIARHWGARVILQVMPSQGFLVARAIQQVSLADIRHEMLFTYTGWVVINGQRGFLTATGLLTPDGLDENILVDLGVNNLKHYALLSPSSDPKQRALAISASLDFLRLGPRQITAPIWAAMFAAPLTEIRPLNAVIAVYGSTQSGKSTISHLALAHYGSGFINGHDYRAPIDWTSTKTSIEGVMFTVKDGPVIIDDYAPQFASTMEARSMHRSAEYVVRSVGNRSARSRSRSDLSQQTTRIPRGLAIMTAENPLIGQSVVGRMIYVGMQPGDILPNTERGDPPNQKLDDLQARAQQGLLTQATSLYIQHLAKFWDDLSVRFAEMVDASSDWARTQAGLQNRLPDAFGVLNAAQTLALRIFQDMGLLDGAEASQLADENREALLAVISSQAERVAAESPVIKLLSALQSQLAARKIYLSPRSDASIYTPPPGAEMVGWYDPDVIYLDTNRALAAAKIFYRAIDQNLDIMPDALQRQIAQVPGLLDERDKDGRHIRVTKWVGGATRRVLALNKMAIKERYGLDISNTPSVPGTGNE